VQLQSVGLDVYFWLCEEVHRQVLTIDSLLPQKCGILAALIATVMHTFADLAKALTQSTVYLSGLQSRFDLPSFNGAGYSEAYLDALKVKGQSQVKVNISPLEVVRFIISGFVPMNEMCERAGSIHKPKLRLCLIISLFG
jgi:hypothetical protein